jgi:putative nucleotidyltransferase with HDIG domain
VTTTNPAAHKPRFSISTPRPAKPVGLTQAELKKRGFVAVIHLTTSKGLRKIFQNAKKLIGQSRPRKFFQELDALVHGLQRMFNRTDSVFAYPDIGSIDRGRKGSMHLGEEAVIIFVDPSKVYVADASIIDDCGRIQDNSGWRRKHSSALRVHTGHEPRYIDEAKGIEREIQATQRKKVKLAAKYFQTAITLKEYREKGNPGFVLPEVVIPGSEKRYVFGTPPDFSLDMREIEPWENTLRVEARQRYKMPNAKVHPWEHTLAVADNAAKIAKQECPAYEKAAIVGAYLHDLGREDDLQDPAHAKRGAQLVKQLSPKDLSDLEIESIKFAVAHHADRQAPNGDSPIVSNYPEIKQKGLLEKLIAVIWDADRLQLTRRGRVDPRYLSTDFAKRLATNI